MQDFIQQFTFADPWWLLGLIALIPLIFIGGKSGTPTAITYSSLSILASLGRKPRLLPGFVTFSFILLALICAIIAMARPQLRNEQSESTASGVDIILAIDLSKSSIAYARRPCPSTSATPLTQCRRAHRGPQNREFGPLSAKTGSPTLTLTYRVPAS